MKKSFVIFICLALALSTLLVFWQVRNFDFINYDDVDYVSKNLHVIDGLTLENIISAFSTPHVGNWLPLTWLSFMLDCQIFGPNPGWIHLVNVLLHIANTLLLFAVLKKMTGSLWPSAFVAAAFALHPMHVESVAWITERKDVLSTFFLLLTIAAYVSYVRQHGKFRYLLTLLLFILGLLAKPMLVTVPFLLLLLDYWPLGRFAFSVPTIGERQLRKSYKVSVNRNVLYNIVLEKVPFIILAAVSSAITFLVQRNMGAVPDISALSFGQRAANSFLSYWRYLTKMFWPRNLAIVYSYDIDTFSLWQIALCALLLIVITLAVLYFGRKRKYLLVGWLWFILSLIPVIGLIQSGPQGWANRYTYISYIGLFIMAAWGFSELVSKWPYRRFALGTAMFIVLAAFVILSRLEVSYWKNTFTLFSRALAVTQNNYLAHCFFANDLSKHGKSDLAIEHYLLAIKIKPYYTDPILGLGDIFSARGENDRAIEYFQKALEMNLSADNAAHAHNNLGIIFQRKNKLDDALYHYRKAVELRPNSPIAANSLALFFAIFPAFNNSDEAVRLAAMACELTRYRNPSYVNTLAKAYQSAGRFSDAVNAGYIALKLDPNSPIVRRNLGTALLSQQKFKEAAEQFARSLEIEPNNTMAKSNLAWILAVAPDPSLRNPSEAIRLAQEACSKTQYTNPGMLDTLAGAYASAGKFAEAIDIAKKALNLVNTAEKSQLKKDIELHLSFYIQGKPYLESVTKPLPDSNKP